jgi:K+ transporter
MVGALGVVFGDIGTSQIYAFRRQVTRPSLAFQSSLKKAFGNRSETAFADCFGTT